MPRKLNLSAALERVQRAVTASRRWEQDVRETALALADRILNPLANRRQDRRVEREWVQSPAGHWRGPPDTAAVPETEEFWNR